MQEVYKIQPNDYLTYDELITIFKESMPSTMADLIYPKLKKYLCYYNDSYYELLSNITYLKASNVNFLALKISKHLSESFNILSSVQKNEIKEHYSKSYKAMPSLTRITTYSPFIDDLFRREEIKLNTYTNQIHFTNGYLDLQDNTFKQRAINVHYISECIKYNYAASAQEKRNELMNLTINKIIPNEEDRICLLDILGSTITGKSTFDNKALFLYGAGSAGKSTVLDICETALECYVLEIKNDLFSQSSTDYNKVLNTFSNKPQIRITICHELKDERLDSSRFKSFSEGKMNTTKLYQEESHKGTHGSKLITTSNTIPNFIVDSGMIRRIDAYEQKSTFVDDPKIVNESKLVFLKDKLLKQRIADSTELKCAWIDILASHAYTYLQSSTIRMTKNFQASTDLLVSSNDKIQDFIDAKLIITNDEFDRIGKEDMHRLFSETYKDKHLTVQQIITSLKEKKIKYNCDLRSNNVRGCFIGVRIKGFEDDNNDDPLDSGVNTNQFQENTIKEQQKIIEELKKQIEQLKNLQKTQVITEKSHEEIENVKETNENLIDNIQIELERVKKSEECRDKTAEIARLKNMLYDLGCYDDGENDHITTILEFI